jgi:hypothetical protein
MAIIFHAYIVVNWCVFDSNGRVPPRGWARCGKDVMNGTSEAFFKGVVTLRVDTLRWIPTGEALSE